MRELGVAMRRLRSSAARHFRDRVRELGHEVRGPAIRSSATFLPAPTFVIFEDMELLKGTGRLMRYDVHLVF